MAEMKISERQHKDNMELAKKFTLFDDVFMSVVFDGDFTCTGYVISTILGKKLKVVESVAQKEIKNLKGRSVRLDVKAVDSKNRHYDIEIQRENGGAKPRRARYNGSLMDANCENSGEYGENLPETYIIFITEKDYWKKGEPLYVIGRNFTTSKGETVDFDDGLHIIYVNGKYRGDDKIGDLMHDFSCSNPEDMKSKVLKERVAPYKSNEGVKRMCGIMEESNRRAVEEDREQRNEELVLNSLKMNMPVETVAKLLGLSEEKVRAIQQKLLVEA